MTIKFCPVKLVDAYSDVIKLRSSFAIDHQNGQGSGRLQIPPNSVHIEEATANLRLKHRHFPSVSCGSAVFPE
jgi:hypothetical protein